MFSHNGLSAVYNSCLKICCRRKVWRFNNPWWVFLQWMSAFGNTTSCTEEFLGMSEHHGKKCCRIRSRTLDTDTLELPVWKSHPFIFIEPADCHLSLRLLASSTEKGEEKIFPSYIWRKHCLVQNEDESRATHSLLCVWQRSTGTRQTYILLPLVFCRLAIIFSMDNFVCLF